MVKNLQNVIGFESCLYLVILLCMSEILCAKWKGGPSMQNNFQLQLLIIVSSNGWKTKNLPKWIKIWFVELEEKNYSCCKVK